MTWRSTRGAWIEGGRGDLFKGLGIMVLLNQMGRFLLRLKVEGWTQRLNSSVFLGGNVRSRPIIIVVECGVSPTGIAAVLAETFIAKGRTLTLEEFEYAPES